MFKKIALSVLVLSIWLPSNICASTIQLTSGKVIESEITFRDDELIKVDSGYGIDITYYIDEIELIDGKPPIPTEELVEVDGPIKGKEPVEEISDIEVSASIATLEPIVIEEKIEVTEPVVLEKPAIEAEPIKDIRVLEDQMQTIELPSPFGPTIRENNAITENIPAVTKKVVEPLPEAQIIKDEHMTEVFTESSQTEEITGTVESFSKKHKNKNLRNKAHVQKRIMFIQRKLMAIPVEIRKDIFGIMSLIFIFFYSIICFPLMRIAKIIKRKHVWLVWVPIAQIFYIAYIAKKPPWWGILFLIPVVNVILLLVLFIFILRELKKPYWLIIPVLVPGINIFVLWYLAISEIKQS